MQLEVLARQVLSDRLVLASLVAVREMPADFQFPSLDVARADFDSMLSAEPEQESDTQRLLRELGVR